MTIMLEQKLLFLWRIKKDTKKLNIANYDKKVSKYQKLYKMFKQNYKGDHNIIKITFIFDSDIDKTEFKLEIDSCLYCIY